MAFLADSIFVGSPLEVINLSPAIVIINIDIMPVTIVRILAALVKIPSAPNNGFSTLVLSRSWQKAESPAPLQSTPLVGVAVSAAKTLTGTIIAKAIATSSASSFFILRLSRLQLNNSRGAESHSQTNSSINNSATQFC